MFGHLLARGTLIWLLVLCATGHAQTENTGDEESETVTIPLDQIWAWDMPGARDVRDLEKGLDPPPNLISGLREALVPRSGQNLVKQGFAVEGVGIDALREAHAVLTRSQKANRHFRSEAGLSIVFFSRQYGYYIHIVEVQKSLNTITIKYLPVPHRTKELTSHFALIPIGRNQPGTYKVHMARMPLERRYVNAGFKEDTSQWESRIVCQSFEFEILETN